MTPGTPTTAPFSSDDVVVIGDWGSGSEAQVEVANAIHGLAGDSPLSLIITTGDNFYSDDATSLFAPYEWTLEAGIDFVISWGNHDIESIDRIEALTSVFGPAPRWSVYPWGAVDIVILDSNQVADPGQISFLGTTLEEGERLAILVFHHPVLSCSSHGDTESITRTWVPLFDEEVVLVLNGHDHNYQRFEQAGVTYVVSGGGGQRLYDLTTCPSGHPPRVAGAEVHHFLRLMQERDTPAVLVLEAIDTDGEIFDRIEILLP